MRPHSNVQVNPIVSHYHCCHMPTGKPFFQHYQKGKVSLICQSEWRKSPQLHFFKMCQHPSWQVLGPIQYPPNTQSWFTPVTPVLPRLCPIQEMTSSIPLKMQESKLWPLWWPGIGHPTDPSMRGGQWQGWTLLTLQRMFQAPKPTCYSELRVIQTIPPGWGF